MERTEDKGKKKSFPRREVPENNFGGVRLAFRSSTNSHHSFFSNFDILFTKGFNYCLCSLDNLTILTRSENNQFALAVPGVSGKKK